MCVSLDAFRQYDRAGTFGFLMREVNDLGSRQVRVDLSDPEIELDHRRCDERQHRQGRHIGSHVIQRKAGDQGAMAVESVEQRPWVAVKRPLGYLEHDLERRKGSLDVRPQVAGTVGVQGQRLDVEEQQRIRTQAGLHRGSTR